MGLFYSSHKVMIRWWSGEDYNYCYLIPFVVFYLIWEKRQKLCAIPSTFSWVGLLPVIFGIALYWLGELGGEYYTIYISSWLLLVGLLWLHMGLEKLKVIAFPVFFILTMFPPPDFVYKNLSLKLKLISSQIGVVIMQAYGMSAFREGNIIDIGFTKLQVVDACSGLRYLIPLVVLGLLMAYLYRGRLWKKALILIFTLPLTIATNSLRIAVTGILSEMWGSEVAEGFFHGFSGWFIFMFSLVVLISLMWGLNKVFPESQKSKKTAAGDDRPEDLVAVSQTRHQPTYIFKPPSLVAAIFIGMTVFAVQGIEFRETIPIKRSLNEFPLLLEDWKGGIPVQMGAEFLDQLELNDYTIVNFKNRDGAQVNFYVAYYESQRKGESIHSPRTCLPGSGWEFRQAGSIQVPLSEGASDHIKVNRAVISKAGYQQLSYYWFPMRGRVLTNLFEMKWYNFWDAITRQRTDGALVRLITPIRKNEKINDADARLQAFTRELVPVLDQFLPQ
jgi:exosortase D (VPLPA-CTERM-specific)